MHAWGKYTVFNLMRSWIWRSYWLIVWFCDWVGVSVSVSVLDQQNC